MYMRLNAVLTTASIVLTIGPAASSSAAATATWTVKPGGGVSAHGSILVRDPNTGGQFRCSLVNLTGTLKKGSSLPGAGIGSITKATFAQCGVSTGSMKLTVHGLPWTLNALSYNSANGMTRGSLAGVHIHGNPGLAGCTLTLDGTAADSNDGTVKFTYTNSTGKQSFATTGSNLHFYQAFCFGLFDSGDPAVMTGTLTVSPEQTITSP